MSISDSSLSVDVFSEVRSKIVAAAPYVTNSTTSETTLAQVRAAYNDKEPVRPQIVINPIEKDEANWKFGGTEGKKFININIECYYKNTLGVDQLADSVETALKANDINGIDLIGVVSSYAYTNPVLIKYHMKGITFTYDRE